jgi:hypothetical protein
MTKFGEKNNDFVSEERSLYGMLIYDIIPSLLFFLLLTLTLAFCLSCPLHCYRTCRSGERGREEGRKKEGKKEACPVIGITARLPLELRAFPARCPPASFSGVNKRTHFSLQPSLGPKETSTFFLFFLLLSAFSLSLSLSLSL